MNNTNTILPENLNIEQYQSNLKSCLKEETNFTTRTIHNICTGETTVVPHGTMGIVGFVILCLVGLAMVGTLLWVVISLIFDL